MNMQAHINKDILKAVSVRDTVYRASRDSVPVIREVEVVREVRHVPWLAKALSALGVLFMGLFIFRIIRTCRQDLLK